MPCYSPLHGYRAKKPNASGKYSIVFQRSAGFVDQPITVPCGMCIGCRIDKSRQWAIRCTHEAKLHSKNCFVTLTYSDEKLPLDLSLHKSHVQDFVRSLRDAGYKLRYFAVGEYSEANRPHYHLIIFGEDFSKDRKKHSKNGKGDILYTSATLLKHWTYGHHLIGGFNYASAAYTARYVMKKQHGKDIQQREAYTRTSQDTGEVWQVLPEFCLMSRRPGIGSGWYDKYKKDAFPSDFLVVSGKKHPVPRYYLEKLKKEDSTTAKSISAKRKKARMETAPDNTMDRLAVREECKSAQLKQLKRS